MVKKSSIGQTLRDTTKLKNIIKKHQNKINKWLNKKRPSWKDAESSDEESADDEARSEERGERILEDFVNLLGKDIETIRDSGLGEQLLDDDMRELKEFLAHMFEGQPKHSELLESKLEQNMKKYSKDRTDKDVKKALEKGLNDTERQTVWSR